MVLRAGASDSHYISAKLGGPSLVLKYERRERRRWKEEYLRQK